VHAGCFEHEPIRIISDLRGKKVAIPEVLGSGTHLYSGSRAY
jgi:hypothetical protein